jgi:hypothetical protein
MFVVEQTGFSPDTLVTGWTGDMGAMYRVGPETWVPRVHAMAGDVSRARTDESGARVRRRKIDDVRALPKSRRE